MIADAEPPPVFHELSEALRLRGPTLNLLFEQARMSAERDADTAVRDAYATAIISVLRDMLRQYWTAHNGTKREWKHVEPQIKGYSVPQILDVALDSAKHPRTVRIISTVLDLPAKKCGNVAWPVLMVLSSGDSYARVDALIREVAANLADKKCED